jgi:hypothetical protein
MQAASARFGNRMLNDHPHKQSARDGMRIYACRFSRARDGTLLTSGEVKEAAPSDQTDDYGSNRKELG